MLPATPVLLRGHEASLVLQRPSRGRPTHLLLEWADGRRTELAVTLQSIDADGRIVHLLVSTVDGEWAQFADYLGRACA